MTSPPSCYLSWTVVIFYVCLSFIAFSVQNFWISKLLFSFLSVTDKRLSIVSIRISTSAEYLLYPYMFYQCRSQYYLTNLNDCTHRHRVIPIILSETKVQNRRMWKLKWLRNKFIRKEKERAENFSNFFFCCKWKGC